MIFFIKIKDFNKEKVLIGLGSTANYGNNLIFYFHKKQFKLGIINPIQTVSLRKTRIRKVKNDKVDSMLICGALSLGYYNLLIKSFSEKYNKNRAIELKNLAPNSVGINNNALSLQIKMTIELIELLETQIKNIEKHVSDFIKKSDNFITPIPGIGNMTAAINNVQLNTKTFNDYYNAKRLQGKLHYNVLDHCAGKLVRNIFYRLKRNVKFNLD